MIKYLHQERLCELPMNFIKLLAIRKEITDLRDKLTGVV